MAWVYLIIAGGLEVFWSTFMKLSEGFTRLWPSVWTIVGMLASFFFLSQAIKTLPMGTAYGVWTGIGALGAVIVGLVLFLGTVTGVGGGVLRDVCCMERPYIFTKHIYACASLAGAAVCRALWPLGTGLAMLAGCGVTVALRICAAVFRWSFPKA